MRALRLLQEETFRKEVIRPQVIEGLLGAGVGAGENGAGAAEGANGEVEGEGEGGKVEG